MKTHILVILHLQNRSISGLQNHIESRCSLVQSLEQQMCVSCGILDLAEESVS